jgi:phosphohistidine phosphatase
MQLYLMRHGNAEPSGGVDAERALTDLGRVEVEAIALALERAGCQPGVVIHSPLVRSRQSAEIMAAGLGGLRCIELEEVVTGGESLLQLIGALEVENPLVVGHEPSIPRLATALGGLEQRLLFHTAALAAFAVASLPPTQGARLLFYLDPNLLLEPV